MKIIEIIKIIGIILRLSNLWELLYADDLVIMDESLYGLLNQLTPVNIRVVCVRREWATTQYFVVVINLLSLFKHKRSSKAWSQF